MAIVAATKELRTKQTKAYMSRAPRAKAIEPPTIPVTVGQRKFLRRLSPDVFRQARSGPTPVRNSKRSPSGMLTLLKNGAPTLMRFPVNHSEKTGNSVPERIAMQATKRTRLLKRKLDSRETIES